MSDFVVIGMTAGLCVLTWGLIAMCERAARGWAMNGPEIIGLLAAVGLLAYLTIALLKPEWFA